MSVLPANDRTFNGPSGGHVTSSSQLSPFHTRGLYGSDMSRPQSVQWTMRTGPASPRSVRSSTFSPRTTSFVDQSFHRVAHKFSPVGGGTGSPRNPYLARSYEHQRNCWQASRLSVVTPTAWHRPQRPFGPAHQPIGDPAATWPFARSTVEDLGGTWQPPPPPPKTSRTIDFWQ